MNTKTIILLYLIFFMSLMYSQKIKTKIVVDSKTNAPLEFVYISSDDKKINLISNQAGKLIIEHYPKIIRYSFYKTGYYLKNISSDSLEILDTVKLTEKVFTLNEVTISSKITETVLKDKRFYIDDYLILPNNDFILITSRINVNEFTIAYYQKAKGITHFKRISNEKNGSLIKDCFNNLHLLTDKFSRQLLFNTDSTFEFLQKYTRSKFDSTLAICVLKTDTQVVYKSFHKSQKQEQIYFDYKKNSLILDYVMVSKNSKFLLHQLYYNNAVKEMLENEKKDHIYKLQNSVNGSSDESTRKIIQRESGTVFLFERIAKPIYAPIFLRNDTVLIFNFQESKIVYLNKSGLVLQEVSLNKKHFSTYREFELIQDIATQKFYFKSQEYDKAYLHEINLYTGDKVKSIQLEKPFVKKVQVYNSRIYYLVKDKDWDDTSYLYQQNL